MRMRSGRGSRWGYLGFGVMGLALCTSSVGMAQEPGPQSDTQALEKAIQQGDLPEAVRQVRRLPMEDRKAWIDPLVALKEQSMQTPRSQEGDARADDGGGGGMGAAGGGAQANFGPLIQLILSVIDGNWERDGGSDTIMPFASGVWLDAKGVVRPRELSNEQAVEVAKASQTPIVLPHGGLIPGPSELRWISLNQLQGRLLERLTKREAATLSMEWLGGLSRVQFVAYRPESQEWFLGGPAGNFAIAPNGDIVNVESGLPPVLLEDLVSVAGHVLRNRGVLGCSIDPVPDRLVETQAFIGSLASRRLLVQQPKKFTEQMLAKLGDQQIRVMGLEADNPTALALVAADQHLKKLGLGLEKGPKGLLDYMEHAERLGTDLNQAMVRWWFAIRSQGLGVHPDGNVFELPAESVMIMSDKEFLDATGKRVSSGERDLAADAFAKDCTRRMADVQRRFPVYARLRHIIDLTIAMEVIRRELEQGKTSDLKGLEDEALVPRLPYTPQWSSSVGTHRTVVRGSVKTTVAMASGGVTLDPRGAVGKAVKRDETPRLELLEHSDRYRPVNDWMYEGKAK